MKGLTTRCRSVFLLALLAAIIAAVPQAAISILWRSSLLSFDNPATQVIDELTSEKVSYADPLGEACTAVRTAARSCLRLRPGERAGHRAGPVLGDLEARAPPPPPPSEDP